MALPTTYFVVEYDNEAGGPFVAEGANLSWDAGGSTGFIVTVIDYGSTGKLQCALITGSIPTNNDVLTQGGVTADTNGPAPNGDAELILYPAYARADLIVAASGAITWSGPALGATHSFFFDGQTTNVVAGEILTFTDGQKCEVITVESDTGAAGELSVRWITAIDSLGFPDDNDAFTGDIAGNGVLNGKVHDRGYTPLHLHRLLADLNDDQQFAGNDVLSVIDPVPSNRSTDQIITLIGGCTMDDTVAKHMYGGSISQTDGYGNTLYSGLNIQVTSPNTSTVPVLIQNDSIVSEYWDNAYFPDSIAGNIRILIKTRAQGVDIDGKRIKGKLLEFNNFYFEGGTTLGTATTALALFSSTDGNNQTAVGTVAGAPYSSIVITEGYQLLDYNNGNGSTPYAWKLDLGSASKIQAYERTKYIQRRGTSETLNGRNAQLITGVNMNFAYDNESGGPFIEDEIISWGQAEITYSNESAPEFVVGEVVSFVGSGARGRLVYLDDNGTTGTMMFAMEGTTTPLATDTLLGISSGTTADVDTVTSNANFGTALLLALNDGGTTGNLYCQLLTGTVPLDNQNIFGATSNASCKVNGTVATRTINNQWVGVFTGSDFQTNFGIGMDTADATVNDQLRNLLDVVQQPPNNQSGSVTAVVAGDYVTVYPWDGSTFDVNGDAAPRLDQMLITAGVTGGVSTTVVVGAGNIPDNTPSAGFLRLERNSDGEYDLLEYTSITTGTGTFNLGGSTPTAPNTASIGNNLMCAYIDKVATSTSVSFTAVKGASSPQMAITVRRGGVNPIKTFKTTATFGAGGFSVGAVRTSDA